MARLALHGTLGKSAAAISAEGIRCRAGEPSFTLDLCLAACRYASKATNSGFRYSGRAVAEARQLLERGLLAEAPSEAALLAGASAHWEASYAGGVVLFVPLDRWRVRASERGRIRIDPRRREVRGGITKWIEHHLRIEPRPVAGAGGRRPLRAVGSPCRIPKGDVAASLPSTPRLRAALRRVARHAIEVGCPGGLPPEAAALASELEQGLGSQWATAPGTGPELMQEVRLSAVGAALRRAFLSILRASGYRVLKTDIEVVQDEEPGVFWPADEIRDRLGLLEAALAAGPPQPRAVAACVAALRDVRLRGEAERDLRALRADLTALRPR